MQPRVSSSCHRTMRRIIASDKLLLLFCVGSLIVFQLYPYFFNKVNQGSISQTMDDGVSFIDERDRYLETSRQYGGREKEVLWGEHPYQGRRLNDAKTDFEIEDAFSNYATYKQIDCPLKERYGHWKDGGWDICVAPPFDFTVGSCTVYSFGIGLDWSFDDAVAKRKKCEIYSYDPTIGKQRHKRGEYIHFFDIGLEDKNRKNSSRGFETKTFDTFLKENGHTDRIIDMLKIDIEGSEWNVIPNMYRTRVLSNIKQLAMEFHTNGRNTTAEFYKSAYKAMEMLDSSGFRRYHSEPNDHCRYFSPFDTGKRPIRRWGCHNAYFVNINFVK